MSGGKEFLEIERPDDFTLNVLKKINSCYLELTIKKVNGDCPYGHKEGEQYKITSMNHDGLCGALYSGIHQFIGAVHYGGAAPWEKENGFFQGVCPEMGKVQVEIRRREKGDISVFRTKSAVRDMTGKGFVGIDKYRVFLEILGVEGHCTWAHRAGQRFEIDPFNIGQLCGNLYWGTYRHIMLLFAGKSLPWEAEENIIHGVCPDIMNQTAFRMIRGKR